AQAAKVMAALFDRGTRLLVPNRPGHATIDLIGAICGQLHAAGVRPGNVHDLCVDTRACTEDFFSDRAERPCGRFAAIARLR
ncbi:MAG: laccase domain-containing protein, partial [Solirubrobacteraceae bacterium]